MIIKYNIRIWTVGIFFKSALSVLHHWSEEVFEIVKCEGLSENCETQNFSANPHKHESVDISSYVKISFYGLFVFQLPSSEEEKKV